MTAEFGPAPRSNIISYLVAVFGMTLLGVVAVVAVFMFRPDKDNTAIIVTILSFIGPTTGAILAFMKAQETHLSVNSRMDEFQAKIREAARLEVLAARAEGVVAGKEEGAAAANVRTDAIAAEKK